MNDFVLRGFCERCGQTISWETKENYENCPSLAVIKGTDNCNPVWFLSPKQMMIVLESDEFAEWDDPNYKKRYSTIGHRLARFCEEMPFLVAKILEKAGEIKT